MRVFADAQPLQDPVTSRRGIGRYVAGLARAMDAWHAGAVEAWVIDADGPAPTGTSGVVWSGKVRRRDEPGLLAPDVWHVTSPFERLDRDIGFVWPSWARGTRTSLAVTLYDLIPLVFPDRYLADPVVRGRYLARCQLVEHADRVLAISEATAADAVRLLRIPPSRIDVVGAGLAEEFVGVPTLEPSPEPRVTGLRPGYVLYTGGMDVRKNVGGLLEAYSLLPASLRAAHQLVVVSDMTPAERAQLDLTLARLRLADDVLLPGYVPDEELRALYGRCELFVFPSLYEGFGLPVIEAAASGAPVMVGDNSSLVELVPDHRARFIADDPGHMAARIAEVLTDDELRASLRAPDRARAFTWRAVADRTAQSYERIRPRPRGPRQRDSRPLVWLVGPMPPAPTGVAEYSAALLEEVARLANVVVLAQPGAVRSGPADVRWFDIAAADVVRTLYGEPDLVLAAMGNSEHHVAVLRYLREHGATVIAHDVRFSGLLGAVRDRAPWLLDDDTRRTLDAIVAGRRPPRHEEASAMVPHDYYLTNGMLAAPALRGADAVLVHSTSAAALARLDLPADERAKVRVIPFGHRLRVAHPAVPRDWVVSLGHQHWTKDTVTVCRAFLALARRRPDLRFALVGAFVDPHEEAACVALVRDAGLEESVRITGRVTGQEYEEWLAGAVLAVQLRAYTNGESSGVVADCMGAGVPVLATDLAAGHDLTGLVELVAPGTTPELLADRIEALVNSPVRRADLAARAIEHARTDSFAAVARALVALAPARGATG